MTRVYRGKTYTGVRIPGTNKCVHKLRAEATLPENYIPEEVKQKIFEDIAIHNKDTIEYDVERGMLWLK